MSGHEELYFQYTTDSDYQTGNNKAVSVKVPVPTSEDSVALKSQIMYYGDMTGATTDKKGESGLVPAPAEGKANRYLCSDGTWQVPPDNNTTYSVMGAASSTANGSQGLVPAPAKGKQASYLRGDGTWNVPTNTTYTFNSPLSLTGTSVSLNKVPVNKGGTGATVLGAKPGTLSTADGGNALNCLGICAGTASPPNLTEGCFYIKYSS